MNKIWKLTVFSYWPYLKQSRYNKLLNQYGDKINQRWDLFFKIRFILAKKNKNKNNSNSNCNDEKSNQSIHSNFIEGCNNQLNNYQTIISISSLDQTIDIEDIINCVYSENKNQIYGKDNKIIKLLVETGKSIAFQCPFLNATDKSFNGNCHSCKNTLWLRDNVLFLGDSLR